MKEIKEPDGYPFVHVWLNIHAAFVSNLDMTDMEGINNSLNSFWFTGRGRSESQQAEERVGGHHVANDLSIGIVSGSSVSLIDDQKDYVSGVANLVGQIIHKSLGRHIEYTF
jgi:hypothetical protein